MGQDAEEGGYGCGIGGGGVQGDCMRAGSQQRSIVSHVTMNQRDASSQ